MLLVDWYDKKRFELAKKIKRNQNLQLAYDVIHSALPIYPPVTEQLPCVWWDGECDKSLLIGTWKHGYENYTEMRADPTLCFLSRCGPPSDRDLQMATNNALPPTPAL